MPQTIQCKKLHPDAKIPTKGSVSSAGWDVYSVESTVIQPNKTVFIRTGLAFAFPSEIVLLLVPRSSLGPKHNIIMPNSVGIGDADYRGEYMVALRNIGDTEYVVEKGDRVAQILFLSLLPISFVEEENLSDTERGAGGFGSTGR